MLPATIFCASSTAGCHVTKKDSSAMNPAKPIARFRYTFLMNSERSDASVIVSVFVFIYIVISTVLDAECSFPAIVSFFCG